MKVLAFRPRRPSRAEILRLVRDAAPRSRGPRRVHVERHRGSEAESRAERGRRGDRPARARDHSEMLPPGRPRPDRAPVTKQQSRAPADRGRRDHRRLGNRRGRRRGDDRSAADNGMLIGRRTSGRHHRLGALRPRSGGPGADAEPDERVKSRTPKPSTPPARSATWVIRTAASSTPFTVQTGSRHSSSGTASLHFRPVRRCGGSSAR